MSKIWGAMLIISIAVAIFTGNVETVVSGIMTSGQNAVENILGLVGMMCFWNGLFNIFEKTSAIKTFSKFFSKIIGKLFNKKELNEKAVEYMSMNMASNIVGIGNAATVNGIKAIEELQKENPKKDEPNDNMTTFVLVNTASLQLIPTNIIALRALYGSSSPSAVIFPIWIVTAVALIFGIVSIKILNKRM